MGCKKCLAGFGPDPFDRFVAALTTSDESGEVAVATKCSAFPERALRWAWHPVSACALVQVEHCNASHGLNANPLGEFQD